MLTAEIVDGAREAVLYDPAMVGPLPAEFARGWQPAVAGVREAFHARFRAHAYPPHVHDTWTLFLVDEGAIRYELDRRPRAAPAATVSILPPYVAHDGRDATGAGFEMRCLYLDADVLGEGAIGAAVDRPTLELDRLRDEVAALHDAVACRDDALEAEMRLAFVTERVREALGAPAEEPPEPAGRREAEALRAELDARLGEPMTLAAAAAALGGSPTGLARAFTASFGLAPHAYRLGRRLDVARERILGGAAIADVAADLGFADQAHLTRRFRQWFGTTPAALRRLPSAGGTATTSGTEMIRRSRCERLSPTIE